MTLNTPLVLRVAPEHYLMARHRMALNTTLITAPHMKHMSRPYHGIEYES